MAVPRPRTGDPVALPRPLDGPAAARLSRAFADPSAPLDALGDNPLLGHVLAERLLTAARPSVPDLRAWLDRYADYPDAPAIHAVLLKAAPKDAPGPAPELASITVPPPGDLIEARSTVIPRRGALDRAVRDALRNGDTGRALSLVSRTRGLRTDYAALLRAEVAQALFSLGRDDEALRVAEAANRLARGTVPLAPWIGGLAAWRLGRPELARTWFEAAWRAPTASSGRRAAAAFWAARATLHARGTRGPWLQRAAHESRTFYGLLARRMLGRTPLGEAVPVATLAEADVDAIGATPRGERAFALLQVRQPGRAAAELHVLWAETRDRPGYARSIRLIARAAGLNELGAQMDAVQSPASAPLPAARLRPAGGFTVDPALLYALAKLESNFDPAAVSPAGARGLLQLMPETARFLLADTKRPIALHDPATNLQVGQRYITRLAGFDSIGTDLVRMLAAYNAGIGNYARWTEQMGPQDDPLLFIEALPGAETRAYIPRALAYSWLYAAELHVPSPSLDELAAGNWPQLRAPAPWREVATRLH